MLKKLSYLIFLFAGLISFGQEYPILNNLTNSSTALPLDATITWSAVNQINGTIDAHSATILEWTAISGGAGYKESIENISSNNDIIDEMVFLENTTGELNLPANSTLYIATTPLNTIRDTVGHTQVAFKAILACDHTINSVNDFYFCDHDFDSFAEFNIDLIALESQLIGNQSGLTVTYHNAGGDLIDFETQYAVNQRTIRARATNSEGCYKETSFKLIVVAPPIANNLNNAEECQSYTLPSLDQNNQYFTQMGGRGNILKEGDVITSSQSIYIYISRGNCSNESSFRITIDQTICEEPKVESSIIFPKFFTPNGDGINDFWQFIPPLENAKIADIVKGNISIFDRYGRLIVQIDPKSRGWDGSYKGEPVPSSDYWFTAVSFDRQEIKGHFALKR